MCVGWNGSAARRPLWEGLGVRADLTLRREADTDRAAVIDLIDDAFGPAAPSSASEMIMWAHVADRSRESLLVEQLRADGDVRADLTLVAELEGTIVGQVTCSRGVLAGRECVALGPICVQPRLQRTGIGAALVAAVIAGADVANMPAIVLLGDPGYYTHFGFEPARSLGIVPPVDTWEEHFMAKRLRSWRPDLAGPFAYPPAFEAML